MTIQRPADSGKNSILPGHIAGKAYLAGPITGNIYYRDEFNGAEKDLSETFDSIVNPVKLFTTRPHLDYGTMMKECLNEVARCQSIVMLPGWQKSPGANQELECAKQNGLKLFELLYRFTAQSGSKLYSADVCLRKLTC